MKNKIFLCFLILMCKPALADLKCSEKGTKLFYVNGIFVSSDAAESTQRHIGQTLVTVMDSIDNNKTFATESVYNTSRGFFRDVRETKELLMQHHTLNTKQEYYEAELQIALKVPRATGTIVNDINSPESSDEYIQARVALKNVFKKYQISNEQEYRQIKEATRSFNEVEFLKYYAVLNKEVHEILKNAAADVSSVNKVMFKIADSLKNGYKVIFISHSEGNEVLRSAARAIKQNPTDSGFSSIQEYQETFDKVFGTVQIAPPSDKLVFCDGDSSICKSQYVLLENDLIINQGNNIYYFLDGYYDTPSVAPNFKVDFDSTLVYNRQAIYPVKKMKESLAKTFFYAKTFLAHGMDAIYLDDKIYATVINGGTPKSMSNIFKQKTITVAENLADNCDAPEIDIEVAGAYKDLIIDTVFNYNSITDTSNRTSITAIDKNDNDGTTNFEFNYNYFDRDLYYVPASQDYFSIIKGSVARNVVGQTTINDFSIPFSNSSYPFTVKATNERGKVVTKTFYIKTFQDRPPTSGSFTQSCHTTPSIWDGERYFYYYTEYYSLSMNAIDYDSSMVHSRVVQDDGEIINTWARETAYMFMPWSMLGGGKGAATLQFYSTPGQYYSMHIPACDTTTRRYYDED